MLTQFNEIKMLLIPFFYDTHIYFIALYLVFAFQKMKKQYNDKGEVEYV